VSSPRIRPSLLAELRDHARCAAEHNYARYSGLLVVAAVETIDGTVFGGTNVEVANYALTKHAEEMAIIRALATRSLRNPNPNADRWLRTLYVCGAAPCGSCLQFALEWATPRARCVIDLPAERRFRVEPLRKLLPMPFGAVDIGEDRRPGVPAGGCLPPSDGSD
jgi:cytidine deaminase